VRGTVARLIGAGRLDDKGFADHCAGMTTANDDDARHKAKMANRKAAQDKEVAAKTIEKGLLIVHTGKGKGKSTAAFGLMMRALGRGFRCGVAESGHSGLSCRIQVRLVASAIFAVCGLIVAAIIGSRPRTARISARIACVPIARSSYHNRTG